MEQQHNSHWHCLTFYVIALQPFKFIWSNWMPLAGAMTFKSTPIYIIIFYALSHSLSPSLPFVRYIFTQFELYNSRCFTMKCFEYFVCIVVFSAPSLMVSISSTVPVFFSFYKCNCNRIKHAPYFDCMEYGWTIYVNCRFTHNDKLFPLTDVTTEAKNTKWKKRIIENCCA